MTLTRIAGRLAAALTGQVRMLEPMSRHTTYRIGGPADLFITCDTISDLGECIRVVEEEGLEWMAVGKGSNLLVADEGYRGAILTLGREFKTHSVEGSRIKTGAGCVLAYVVQDAFTHRLGGMEFAVGIPGTVGGALVMNAGSRDVWMESVVESITLYVPGAGLRRLRPQDIAWGYRSSGLAGRGIVAEAVIRLTEADRDRIRYQMELSLLKRKGSQPLGVPSAGSVFANPPGDSAGRLIEEAGLKGARIGGAQVSEVHANFIVNVGRATASDVARLMSKVQMTVRDTYGIELKPEIRFVGEFATA